VREKLVDTRALRFSHQFTPTAHSTASEADVAGFENP